MADNPPQPQTNRLGQLILIALIIGAGVWAFMAISQWALRNRNGQHSITLRVEGTASLAVITYTQENGVSTKPAEVRIPWEKTLSYKPGTIVVITAANPMQMGSLTCIMRLDRQSWKKDTANSPLDKISCAGMSP